MSADRKRGGVAERIFLFLGRASSRAPRFRGKAGLVLRLFKLLHLDRRHINVQAQLRRPVNFVAELDLHAWLQRLAFVTGEYEAGTVELLLKLHSASGGRGYLLDVGANIGLIAIPFALSRKRNGVVVVAIEAVPDNVAVLERNIEANQLGDVVRVIPVGVGDAPAVVDIQVEGDLKSGEGTGTANILPVNSTYECVRQTLTIKTIDELFETRAIPSGCSVIKIDTDGYDLKVLQGAAAFLGSERPVIFGEFSAHCMKWHGQSVADVMAFAHGSGYETWRRVERTWSFQPMTTQSAASFNEDLLLVPIERAADYRRLESCW